jgi:diketogulonate reductase-like aldo/keto reductase
MAGDHGCQHRSMKARTLPSTGVRTVNLPSGEPIPVLGMGTWHMAEDPARRVDEILALRTGLDLGLALVDTAEMYADGAAESLVGEAIRGRRSEVFLVSKVLPSHATRAATVAACHASLRRLHTDYLDLYLLHWRGATPLAETLEAFDELVAAGTIRYWGVSNFDVGDMVEVTEIPGGEAVATDQVLYNLERRGIEYDLLPWCRRRSIPIMAYSPIEQGRLLTDRAVRSIAADHDCTPAQVCLAWVLRRDGVNAIPKASTPEHVWENRLALEVRLRPEDFVALDRAFPPPATKVPLQVH